MKKLRAFIFSFCLFVSLQALCEIKTIYLPFKEFTLKAEDSLFLKRNDLKIEYSDNLEDLLKNNNVLTSYEKNGYLIEIHMPLSLSKILTTSRYIKKKHYSIEVYFVNGLVVKSFEFYYDLSRTDGYKEHITVFEYNRNGKVKRKKKFTNDVSY